jgi:hypothetical protein
MTRTRRGIATALAALVCWTGLVHGAQAALIGADAVAAAQAGAESGAPARERLAALLERGDVVRALHERGVDAAAARERVAALTDAEAAWLAERIDTAPAGGDVLGTIVFIFVLLLVTDILGFTKIFPFTRSIR